MVWIHGGAWLSGSKNNAVPYFQLIAAAGYTVISVDYSPAPGARYPVALRQVNQALAHVLQHADRYHEDTDRIFLSGDSAGAQLAGQITVLTMTPGYADGLVLRSALRPEQLAGMVLHCGAGGNADPADRRPLAAVRGQVDGTGCAGDGPILPGGP